VGVKEGSPLKLKTFWLLNVPQSHKIYPVFCDIDRWNSLSQEDVDAPSVNAFKGHLKKKCRCQMGLFEDC